MSARRTAPVPETRRHGVRDQVKVGAVAGICLFLAACSSAPISLRRLSPQVAFRANTANALSTGEPSNPTRIVLRRHDLTQLFNDAPADAIRDLHFIALTDNAGSGEIFALAELSYLYAARAEARLRRRALEADEPRWSSPSKVPVDDVLRERARSNFLAAAIYSYAFVFPDNVEDQVSMVDPRIRLATDLYNGAIAQAFSHSDGIVYLEGGVFALPFGILEVAFDATSLRWGERRLENFQPLAEFDVRGLNNRYRTPGIGAPLAARSVWRDPESKPNDFVAKRMRVATTAFLRIPHPRQQLRQATLSAELEVYAANEAEVIRIGDRVLPLESQPSAAIAASLSESRFWEAQLAAFLGTALDIDRPNELFAAKPYVPGRIPIVFVHGTYSSPAAWANLLNDLQSDPRIRHRYQFWFFSYDSGNPIIYSSMQLRRSLEEAVRRFDPQGRRECLHDMVVIGHSQGGMLTKMTAIDSGTRFWDAISSAPFDEASLRPATREFVQEAVFVKPLPFVKRVVFISTPHRGSYLAGPQIIRRLASRLIQFPANVVDMATDLSGLRQSVSSEVSFQRIPTSIDNMSPSHPFVLNLSKIPVAPGVAANSIIAVKGDGPVESGNDGVVRYSSAHIDGVESELVVRSGHSAQSNPHTVEEVRRILFRHADASTCGG